jgi:paraquat-inducible protein B
MTAHELKLRGAAVRSLHRMRWIWLVPAAAAAIVLWMSWQTIVARGPLITITMDNAEGVVAGQTKVKHRNVDVGTVQSVALSPDMSWTIVSVRMSRDVAPYLNTGTHFWVVRPRLTASGITGLTTILSGAYIEMDPGNGTPTKAFKGFDEDSAVLKPTQPGRGFVLVTGQLGSIAKESKITYHGVPVGQVLGYKLEPNNQKVDIFVYIFAPYENLVTSQTRFWNASGINIGSIWSGFKINGTGFQDLFTGGDISFDTVAGGPAAPAPSKADSQFPLYDSEKDARSGKPPQIPAAGPPGG